MKNLLTLVLVFSLSSINLVSECSYCQLPDDWDCVNDGGQELFDNGQCYRGFRDVDINEEEKSVSCFGEGYNKCTIPNSMWLSSLHNALIEHANNKIYNDNVTSGDANINMIIDGFPRYGYVTLSKNPNSNLSVINTIIN